MQALLKSEAPANRVGISSGRRARAIKLFGGRASLELLASTHLSYK
jgi:hypothetical protein